MKILIIDTETTGLDPKKDSIIEVAAILVDLSFKRIESQCSALLYAITNSVSEKLTGITQSMLDGAKVSHFNPFDAINSMVKQSECVVAHNAEFDRKFLESKEVTLKPLEWICSYRDIEYNLKTENKKLSTLAEAYNVNPDGAHRALADVTMVANIFFKISNIEEQIKTTLIKKTKPLHKLVAITSYNEKDIVKNSGFRWDPKEKIWWKNVHADNEDLNSLINTFPFKIRV